MPSSPRRCRGYATRKRRCMTAMPGRGRRCGPTTSSVTLFGGVMGGSGWEEIEPIFRRLGASFSDCSSYGVEVIAAAASDGLAYTVAFEHTTASVDGGPPSAYVLRVTTVFRREDGEWKVVHRHADPLGSTNAGEVLQQLVSDSRHPRSLTAAGVTNQKGATMTTK